MKDEKGLYFHPVPGNRKARMYIREENGEILFRLWLADDPEMWEGHGWVPHEAIVQAAAMYENKSDFDPISAYDLRLAEALIKEEKEEKEE